MVLFLDYESKIRCVIPHWKLKNAEGVYKQAEGVISGIKGI